MLAMMPFWWQFGRPSILRTSAESVEAVDVPLKDKTEGRTISDRNADLADLKPRTGVVVDVLEAVRKRSRIQ